MKKCLSYLLPLFLVFSCGVRNPVLRDAARVIEDHPDSALYLLDGVSRVDLASDREKAEYDYLNAEAFYRTYFFLDDATEAGLERACFHFEENGPEMERMRAWELMGTVQTAVGRYGSGMVSFRKAGAVAREIECSRSRLAMMALLIAAILSTLVLYFWARKIQTERLLAEKQAENERYLSAAEDLQSKLSALKADRPRLGGIDTLDRLCEQYYVFEGTSNLQPRILSEVKAIVEGLRSDTKAQKNLEQALDERTGGVMKRLRAAFPKWKDEDFLLYLFTASGFSATTISTLLEKDKPYVYNRLYRLKERIKASSSPDSEDFLACLEK
ncbi:MAG: hypothetical protein IJ611_04020 [Bacteroidales bacterium]|nr:hypothetical protein [Bacteroidales bacterium]